MSDFAGLDLAAGDVTGMRVWNLDVWGRLTGVSYPVVWTPGENVAACRRANSSYVYFDKEAEGCPGITDPKCGCGFWAYHYGGADHTGHVTGIISGYGKTTIGERGFRCEKAKVVAFSMDGVTRQHARMLSRNYPDVPQFPDVDAMLDAFPVSDEYAPSPATVEDFWTRDLTGETLKVSLTTAANHLSSAFGRYSAFVAPSTFSFWEYGTSADEDSKTDRQTVLRNLAATMPPARSRWYKP